MALHFTDDACVTFYVFTKSHVTQNSKWFLSCQIEQLIKAKWFLSCQIEQQIKAKQEREAQEKLHQLLKVITVFFY